MCHGLTWLSLGQPQHVLVTSERDSVSSSLGHIGLRAANRLELSGVNWYGETAYGASVTRHRTPVYKRF